MILYYQLCDTICNEDRNLPFLPPVKDVVVHDLSIYLKASIHKLLTQVGAPFLGKVLFPKLVIFCPKMDGCEILGHVFILNHFRPPLVFDDSLLFI